MTNNKLLTRSEHIYLHMSWLTP